MTNDDGNAVSRSTSASRSAPALTLVAVVAALLSLGDDAHAFELELPADAGSLRVGVTQTMTGEWHADFDVLTGNPNDKFFDLKNRSELLLMHGSTNFKVRLDGFWVLGADDDSAHVSRTTLEKISLSSVQRHFDLTAGDFYIRVGRGIALDLTKVDELTRDATVRGGRVGANLGPVRLLIFGGWINPLDVDDATEEPRDIPSDLVGGGSVEVRVHRHFIFGGHYVGAGLESPLGDGRNASHIFGVAAQFPALFDRLSIYGEFNYLNRIESTELGKGTATYVSATTNLGPVALLAEFRFYRQFQFRNNFGSEANTFIYNRPPTLTRQKQEILNNSDVMGPRLRVDVRIGRVIVFGNFGYFFRSDAGPDESFFDAGVRAIDGFGGVQLPLLGGQLDTAGGYRVDTREGDEGETIIDYKQAFVEADLSIPVFRKHNFELQLEYRNISKQGNDFQDFTIAVSYRPFKWFSGGASYEYTTEFNSIDTEGEISPRQHFGAVQATFNFTELSHARLFAGSTRGGLRCVDGFCRIFPPFIGVRTELVLQF